MQYQTHTIPTREPADVGQQCRLSACVWKNVAAEQEHECVGATSMFDAVPQGRQLTNFVLSSGRTIYRGNLRQDHHMLSWHAAGDEPLGLKSAGNPNLVSIGKRLCPDGRYVVKRPREVNHKPAGNRGPSSQRNVTPDGDIRLCHRACIPDVVVDDSQLLSLRRPGLGLPSPKCLSKEFVGLLGRRSIEHGKLHVRMGCQSFGDAKVRPSKGSYGADGALQPNSQTVLWGSRCSTNGRSGRLRVRMPCPRRRGKDRVDRREPQHRRCATLRLENDECSTIFEQEEARSELHIIRFDSIGSRQPERAGVGDDYMWEVRRQNDDVVMRDTFGNPPAAETLDPTHEEQVADALMICCR
mmetsp:Transcript_29206/g.96950  ORF Transcript_29206/g.96950 Transcript_29206/m.96950 type:complete len:355 (+) Transcript_29206:486-1550(+)